MLKMKYSRMYNKYFYLAFLFCLSTSFYLNVQAQKLNPYLPENRLQVEKGLLYTVNNHFDSAKVVFKEMINHQPDSPIGYFYYGATLQAQMLDGEDFSQSGEFTDYMEKAIELSREYQKSDSEKMWSYFYEGSAFIYESYQNSKLDKWFTAFKDARKGVGLLEKVIEMDSTCYDAYLGVGSYKYWKSAKAGYLTWLPIIRDEREKGIKMVRLAAQKSKLGRLVARDQLCWILLYEKEFDEAMKIATQNMEKYPQSRFLRWTYVELAYESEAWGKAFSGYEWLLNEIVKIPGQNHYNELECLVKMAEIKLKLGDPVSAAKFASQLLAVDCSPEIAKKAKKKIKRANEILNITREKK